MLNRKSIVLKSVTICALVCAVGIPNSFAANTNKSANSKSTSTSELKITNPSDLKWDTSMPNVPQEIKMTTLMGDMKKRGLFVIRVNIPANFEMQPHYVNTEQNVTVLSGTLNMGQGDKFNKSTTSPLTAGTFVMLPKDSKHYLWTGDESAVVQISGVGPADLKMVNATAKANNSNTSNNLNDSNKTSNSSNSTNISTNSNNASNSYKSQ